MSIGLSGINELKTEMVSGRILVTGADGFVGSALTTQLQECGYIVRAAVRTIHASRARRRPSCTALECITLSDDSSDDETKDALKDVQTLVHLAARVHIMSDVSANPLHDFRRVNVRWTERRARLAVRQGVSRLVFLSSVKVNGEQTTLPFTEQDTPHPEDPYGLSKWEAEQVIARVSAETGLETVIVRSPLVYGSEVQGNFLQLLKIIDSGIPLPFAAVHNQRSLIYRKNLLEALIQCVNVSRAAGETYLVSDGEDLSTPELIRRLGTALGVRVRLLKVPTAMLRCTASMLGKRNMIDRLVGSLQVDSSKIRRQLGWRPCWDVEAGILEVASWFRAQASSCST
jgi:nucleoside-diphosphate-sugar epimerase